MFNFFKRRTASETTRTTEAPEPSTALDLTAEHKASSSYTRRIKELEEQVSAIPDDAGVGGGAYIIRNNKRFFVAFKSKSHMLRLLEEAKKGDIEILLG